jgi:predicted nucleic acid-binding protein
MPVVIDASALVELLLHSERAPAVLQAVGTTDMVAPDGSTPRSLDAARFERTGKLARDLGCPLVTGDLRLSRAPRLGVPPVTV